jgi:DNA-binding transcriptional LysR family regulator
VPRESRFELADLRLIRAIVEAGSLSRAARRLAIDHSTAFRRLETIEKRLSVRFFERARDGYTPTPAGELAYAAATQMLDGLGDLDRRLAGENLRPAGTVRVTTADTLLELLSPIFADHIRERPEIMIELVIDNSFFNLTKRDADIAIRPIVAPPDDLTGRRLAAVATAPYASPAYLSRQSRDASLTRLDWIGFDESLGHLQSARWLRRHIADERIVYRANSLLALQAAARAGMGVAALPCYLADPDRSLQRACDPLLEMEVSLWLLTHPDLKHVVRIRTVLDFLADRLARCRSRLEGSDRRST